eukprot:m.112049 g.112049  ORF g.112049 m.112049 type:complete len:140 (+) comp15402_c0_seq18:26-445(+)
MSHILRRLAAASTRSGQYILAIARSSSASAKAADTTTQPHQDVSDLKGFQAMFDMETLPTQSQATTQATARVMVDPFTTRSVANFEAKLAKIPKDVSKRKQFRQLQPSYGLMQRLDQLKGEPNVGKQHRRMTCSTGGMV